MRGLIVRRHRRLREFAGDLGQRAGGIRHQRARRSGRHYRKCRCIASAQGEGNERGRRCLFCALRSVSRDPTQLGRTLMSCTAYRPCTTPFPNLALPRPGKISSSPSSGSLSATTISPSSPLPSLPFHPGSLRGLCRHQRKRTAPFLHLSKPSNLPTRKRSTKQYVNCSGTMSRQTRRRP